ncbi:hypothetical protein Pyn_19620 [Prunus yedoensis var. nudiflora]|uniref:Non-haem dioxygenase N-terminal domain-containing protein n=1 Tax=Prunus yedoensis var. nudiflora TaxID=2094558 RepID=A0A314XRY6_PRUYE|nr:hypothetical protein Pyn_19620 [Prunus yedoensis var. nudiflora]
MGSDSQCRIPVIELSINSVRFERGTDDWHHLSKSVREACENYGCFEVVYDNIPLQLRAETFSVIKELFSLPLEAKQKNINPKPFHGYFGQYASIPCMRALALKIPPTMTPLKASQS